MGMEFLSRGQSAEVKEIVELYIYCSSGASLPILGRILLPLSKNEGLMQKQSFLFKFIVAIPFLILDLWEVRFRLYDRFVLTCTVVNYLTISPITSAVT